MSEELLTKSYCSHILQCVEKNQQLKDRITGLGTVALVTAPNIDVYFNNSALIAYVNRRVSYQIIDRPNSRCYNSLKTNSTGFVGMLVAPLAVCSVLMVVCPDFLILDCYSFI